MVTFARAPASRLAALAIASLLAVPGRGLAQAPAPEALAPEALAQILGREAPDLLHRYNVPGVAIAIVTKDGPPQILNFGVGDAATGAPVDDETVFQVGSISKLVTAIGVMRLVDAGTIGFDAPVSRYLRRWRLPPSRFDADGVTVRTILSHSAGLSVHGYFPGSPYPGPVPGLVDSVSGLTTPEEAVTIVSQPGARYSYSGGGYSALQIALEDETRTPFARLIARSVFEPLKLRKTSFAYGAGGRGLARPHDQAGRIMPLRVLPNSAAAGLSTTAGELAILVRAALAPAAGRPGLLSPSASALIATPMAPAAKALVAPSMSQTMLAPETYPDPAAVRYGAGAAVAVRADGRRIVGHSGSNAGWKANVQYAPQSGHGIVVLTNGESGNGVILPLICRWRQWLDAKAGELGAARCPEHAAALIAATFTRDGQDAAIKVLREAAAGSADRWLFSDRTAEEVASALQDIGGLQGRDPARIAAAVAALTATNAELFPRSAFAQARWATALIASGRVEDAGRALDQARALDVTDAETRDLIEAAQGELGDRVKPQERHP